MKTGLFITLLLFPLHLLLWWGVMRLDSAMSLPCGNVLFHLVLSFPALASCLLWFRCMRTHTPTGCLWFCLGLPILTFIASALIIIHTHYPAESLAGYIVLIGIGDNLLCCILIPLLQLLTRRSTSRRNHRHEGSSTSPSD